MKKIHSIIGTIVLICCFVVGSIPTNVLAKTNEEGSEATREFSDSFTELVEIILEVKDQNPQLSEKQMITIIEEKIKRNRGIIDVWEALTDSEKVLVIRYPFDALKVNTARNIATSQTEVKFGYNGLGDRSDAFRHGIWNAEMVILIGIEKAELFATAHEDKDTEGIESDGYSKENHKAMDLHNNKVGRTIGLTYIEANEDELADIIYSDIYSENTTFQWLHE